MRAALRNSRQFRISLPRQGYLSRPVTSISCSEYDEVTRGNNLWDGSAVESPGRQDFKSDGSCCKCLICGGRAFPPALPHPLVEITG
jgi:hypothetical protein